MTVTAADIAAGLEPPLPKAIDFLTRMFAHAPDGEAVSICAADRTTGEWRCEWGATADLSSSAAMVAELAETSCVYFGLSTCPEPLPGTRASAEDCSAYVAFGVDLDVAGPTHKDNSDLPETFEEAGQMLARFPLAATVTVNTGGGLQAFWLLDEPLAAADAGPVLDRWAAFWEQVSVESGRHVDNTSSVAQLMRLPGTSNLKAGNPIPVEIVEADWTRTFGVDDLDEHGIDPPEPPTRTTTSTKGDGNRPGDAYNRQPDAALNLILKLKFHSQKNVRGRIDLVRDGKVAREGIGASVYDGDDGDDHDYVVIWSETCRDWWPKLKTRHRYDPFGLYTDIFHDGDFTAASDELEAEGYGTKKPDIGWGKQNGEEGDPAAGLDIWLPTDRPARPQPDPAMFHGPIGAYAVEAAEHTEADPVAIFAQGLAMFGAMAHRSSFIAAGNDRHTPALFVLIAGATAKGSKGTAFAVTRELGDRTDPLFMRRRVLGGFGSGEAIIAELATDDDNDQQGPRDTRALIFESEFGGLLAVGGRQGSTTSSVIRNMWDGRPLQNRTRGAGKLVAADYHVAAIGHITAAELRAKLTDTDLFGGFANRWLLFYVERGRLHPDGGNVPADLVARHAGTLRARLEAIRRGGIAERTPDANDLWHDVYHALAADDPPGLLGSALSRAAPQCLRLSLVLALADGTRTITADHVGAAYLTWQYCRASSAVVFGESTGSHDADRLLDALRLAGKKGMDYTAQHDLFSRHKGRAEGARQVLEDAALAATITVATGGRPKQVTYAIRARGATS